MVKKKAGSYIGDKAKAGFDSTKTGVGYVADKTTTGAKFVGEKAKGGINTVGGLVKPGVEKIGAVGTKGKDLAVSGLKKGAEIGGQALVIFLWFKILG